MPIRVWSDPKHAEIRGKIAMGFKTRLVERK